MADAAHCLLEDSPEVQPDLRELVARVRDALPNEPKRWIQTNMAYDNTTLFAVQDGTQEIHYL